MKKENILYLILKFLIFILLVGLTIFCVFAISNMNLDENNFFNNNIDTAASEIKISFNDLAKNVTNGINGSNLLNSVNNSKEENRIMNSTSEAMLYNQLNNNSKIIYTKLKNSVSSFDDNTSAIDFGNVFNELLHKENGDTELNNSFQMALDTFVVDNPDLFYLDFSDSSVSIITTSFGGNKSYSVKLEKPNGETFFATQFKDKQVRENAIANVSGLRNQIIGMLNGSTKEKIKQVHDCLIDNLQYDESLSRINSHNIYGALVERNVVCEGYAKAFKYILDGAGIPCMLVTGSGTNSSGETETHAWNYVKIDEIWYAVDVTWDDPILIGDGELPNDLRYKFFLKGKDTFFNNHVEDLSRGFRYPTISTVQY